jgi:glyceraldehyde 3-phosphate dehydrogenase
VSLVDFVAVLKRTTTAEEINAAFKSAAEGPLKGILGVTDEPLVSVDFMGDPRSGIVDLLSTKVIDGNLAKVIAWYDNEWGYSCRLVDLAKFISH